MSTPPNQTKPKRAKRETWTIVPPEDIQRMMARALKELGATPDDTHGLRTRILVDCARAGMQSRGLARKKDLAQ